MRQSVGWPEASALAGPSLTVQLSTHLSLLGKASSFVKLQSHRQASDLAVKKPTLGVWHYGVVGSAAICDT